MGGLSGPSHEFSSCTTGLLADVWWCEAGSHCVRWWARRTILEEGTGYALERAYLWGHLVKAVTWSLCDADEGCFSDTDALDRWSMQEIMAIVRIDNRQGIPEKVWPDLTLCEASCKVDALTRASCMHISFLLFALSKFVGMAKTMYMTNVLYLHGQNSSTWPKLYVNDTLCIWMCV